MLPCQVWENINKLSFFENAILLETKSRSQGKPIKSNNIQEDHDTLSERVLSRQTGQCLLDDFALLVSGAGGKDNVCAVCLEVNEQHKSLVLRVARNEGLNSQVIHDLNQFVQFMVRDIPTSATEIHERQQEILQKMVLRCKSRLSRHVERFVSELKNTHCQPRDRYEIPRFVSDNDQTEAAEDLELFGRRCRENHDLYMRACIDRLNQLRDQSCELIRSSNNTTPQQMMALVHTAYKVRRSSSFREFLKHNLQKTKRPETIVLIIDSIVERLGKISRFFRAASAFTAIGIKLLENGMAVQVQSVPTSKVEIRELSGRTPAQLRQRGGQWFSSCSDNQLQGMINRWPKYRLHSEIQLIIFYQQNLNLELYSNYIGCDKLSCYLCYEFITEQGRFDVKGCHQSLYSLWAVPAIVAFEDEKYAETFVNALRALSEKLERKVRELRDPQTRWKYATNNESIANLSRLSLAISTVEQKKTRHSRHKDILPYNQKQDAKQESLANAQSHLAIIAEDSPPKLPQVMDLTKETAKLEFGPGGSAAEPADVVLESPNNQVEKRHQHKSAPARSILPLRNDGHGKHKRHRRKEENRSYSQYPQLRCFDCPSRTKAGSRIRRKYQTHARRQEPRNQRRYKNCSRRQYPPASASSKSRPSNFKRLLCLCSRFLHRCFGDYRYTKS